MKSINFIIKGSVFFLFLLLVPFGTLGQDRLKSTYTVQVTTFLCPPYNLSLTGQTITGDIWANVKAEFDIPDNPGFNYEKETGNLSVTDQDGNTVGTIIIPPKDREILENKEPFTYVIEDSKGNIYTVTGDGKNNSESGETGNISGTKTGEKQNSGGNSTFNPGTLDTKDLVVTFHKSPNSVYAFDTWEEYYKDISLINNKNLYEHLGGYNVPCKLVPPGKTDVVGYEVQIVKNGIDVSKIVFKTGTGYLLQHDAERLELTLNGGNPNDAQDVYALYPDGKDGYHTVGKLKVVSYSERTFNLVLVPVNGRRLERSEVASGLNSIFNPLGIRWNVSQDEDFEYAIGTIQSDGSGLLSQYPSELSALNSAYKSSRGTDKNTAYFFVLGQGNIKDSDPEGFMPRGKQFGYLFTDNGGRSVRSIAHELGHGLFRLRHTFDGEYGQQATAQKGKTNNLMDYGGGTHLAKWQWDEIFSPALLVNPFEGDEEAMFFSCNAPQPKNKGTREAENATTLGRLSGTDPKIITQCTKTWYYHTESAPQWYEKEKYLEIVQPVIKGLILAQSDDMILELDETELYDVYRLKLNYLGDFQKFYSNENLNEDSFGSLLTDAIVSKAYQSLREDINAIYDRRSGRVESVSPEFELLSLGLGAVIKKISVNIAKSTVKNLSTNAFYATVRNALGKSTSKTALKPLGLGSTGRTIAANLTEQLAMKEIMSNPTGGQIIKESLSDPRWQGWSKMTNKTAHGVEIHYNALWENGAIKAIDDFKFITP